MFKLHSPAWFRGAIHRTHHVFLQHTNYYRLHILAFALIPLVVSGIFYASNGRYKVGYLDSLFLCASAMSVSGLSTMNISELTGFQQAILFVLMIMGDITVVSWVTLLVRKSYFESRCKELLEANRLRRAFTTLTDPINDPEKLSHRRETANAVLEEARASSTYAAAAAAFADMPSNALRHRNPPSHQLVLQKLKTIPKVATSPTRPFQTDDFGGFPYPWDAAGTIHKRIFPGIHQSITRTLTTSPATTLADARTTPWLSFDGLKIGRNSHFHTANLTTNELEEIGGVEYRALDTLSWIVFSYYVLSITLSILFIAPYLARTTKYDSLFQKEERPVPKAWFVAFQSVSLFAGAGLSLADGGMVPFQSDWYVCIVWAILIMAGNMALPIFLRFVVWVMFKLSPTQELHETLSFLLEHPRRCYLYMFPSHQTWFLLLFLVMLSSLEWISFEVLDIGLDFGLSRSAKILVGFFQSISVRASGIPIIGVGSIAPAVQFLYMVCMYIAVYPIATAVRSTNVYEARGLGIWDADPDDDDDEPEAAEVFSKYLMWHVRRQMGQELWWLILGIWAILMVERSRVMSSTLSNFSIFSIVFECVSAFAGIGLSLGLTDYSLSADFRSLSKVVIILLMVRGRLRGLPVAIDRAILLVSSVKVSLFQ